MTFQEYLKQEKPKKMAVGSVIVTPEDCSSILNYNGIRNVTLDFGFNVFSYTTQKPNELPHISQNNNNTTLFTTDEDGNPQVASVFKLVGF